jgi:hypothetical protein
MGWLLINSLDRIWQLTVLAGLKILFQKRAEGLEENYKNTSGRVFSLCGRAFKTLDLSQSTRASHWTMITLLNKHKYINCMCVQPQLIRKYGYPAESHTVVTGDGYLLTMHRIPHGRESAHNFTRTPVLLQHGLLGSSASWIINGPNKGLRKYWHHSTNVAPNALAVSLALLLWYSASVQIKTWSPSLYRST